MPAKTPLKPTEKKTYRLKKGIAEVVRNGLVLKGGDTIQLMPSYAALYADVLEEAK